MPFSFPANPSIGALSTQNSREYRYAGNNTWELVAASGGSDSLLRSLFVPAAPTSVTAAVGNAQSTVSWTAPTGVIAQAPIQDYVVQYSSNGGASWTTFVDLPIVSIASQPSNQTASSGGATFSVSASVTLSATLSYQWQRSTNSGSTWTAISGATSASLALTGLVSGDNGYQYRVVVSATGGATSVTSNAATLTVSSGPIFTSQKQYNGVTENLGLTGLNTNQISFSGGQSGFFAFYHNASSNYNLTITTSITMQATIWSPIAFPGSGGMRKEGDYALTRTYTANTPFTINGIPSGLNPFEMSSGALGANRMTWTIS
jgi:hypothetical protein